MNPRRKLSDILRSGDSANNLSTLWNSTDAAAEFTPLPAGEYVARIDSGELENSRTNQTPGFKMTFIVIEGTHVGRRFWHDIWLSAAALPMAKRDLGKLGVTSLEQLECPLPPGIVCRVKLALRRDDDGTERNKVTTFDVLRVETPTADPFAPSDETEGGSF